MTRFALPLLVLFAFACGGSADSPEEAAASVPSEEELEHQAVEEISEENADDELDRLAAEIESDTDEDF